MGKDKSEKKDKKSKKEKRADSPSGVTKKAKKEKKEKKSRSSDATAALLDQLETADVVMEDGEVAVEANGVKEVDSKDDKIFAVIPTEALVPFANPLADEKQTKKVLKTVKKSAKHKTLKRGVKEVVKSLRKSPSSLPTSASASDPLGIVVLAADISPMDVISHIPVLCEDHNVPYIFVTSRMELGAAGNTKRPTSVVMLSREKGKGEMEEEYKEAYAELTKLVAKATKEVKI